MSGQELDDVNGTVRAHGALVPATSITAVRGTDAARACAYTKLPLGDTSAQAPLLTEQVPSFAKHSTWL